MSSGRPRAERTPGAARDGATDPDWWTSFGYHGVWQAFGLGLPVLWLAFQSPTDASLLGPAVLVGTYGAALGVAAGRQGLLGGRWPRLSTRKLGTGVGYRRYLRRHCLLSATLALATFGGVLVGRAAGKAAAGATALVVALGAVAIVPRLSAGDRPARVGRASLYAAGLAATAVVARPLDLSTAVLSAPVAFAFLAAAAAVDVAWSAE